MAMRPESFNLPTFPTPGLTLLVCYFRPFLSSLHQPTGFLPKTNALLVQSARHMCVQRRAIPMLGRLKDYLLRAKIMFSRELPAHHFYRCRFFRPRRCFKSGDIPETNSFASVESSSTYNEIITSNHSPALSFPDCLQFRGAFEDDWLLWMCCQCLVHVPFIPRESHVVLIIVVKDRYATWYTSRPGGLH